MKRGVWAQIHWFVGITAGFVIVIMGVTGAMLSYEKPLLDALNRDVRRVAQSGQPALEPAALLRRIAEQEPEKKVTALSLSSDPQMAVRVTFAAPRETSRGTGAAVPEGPQRGESRYVDPRTGDLKVGRGDTGEKFLRDVRALHRWLMLGELGDRDIGRQITGASTVLLILLSLSGLYLRWPRRRALNWRAWFVVNFKLRGSAFLWQLHAVVGTYALLIYLLASLTALQWSYPWYRQGLYAMAGVEMRTEGRPPGEAGRAPEAGRAGADCGEGRAGASRAETGQAPRAAADLSSSWARFLQVTASTGYSTANITLPRSNGAPVEIRYLDRDPAHDRAFNTVAIDPGTGAVKRSERYAEKTLGARLIASIFPLHSGSFFGQMGIFLFMVGSLAMPLFAVTGWMMYLKRRRRAGSRTTADEGIRSSEAQAG